MDPITIWLGCLATAWLIRCLAEDAYAGVRGRESPRVTRRRARILLEQQQAAVTGAPTIGQAVTGRIAERIADRRPRGPFRRYVAGLWEDSWTDAEESRKEKRRRKADRATKPEPQQRQLLDTRLCRGGCGLLLVEPWEVCPDCEHAQQPNYRCGGGCGRPVTEPDTWCPPCLDSLTPYEHNDPEPPTDQTDDERATQETRDNKDRVDDEASRSRGRTDQRRRFPPMPRRQSWPCGNGCGLPVSTPDAWCSVCVAGLPPQFPDEAAPPTDQPDQPDQHATTETPEPDPAPDTTRKDPPPMSTPTEINGDIASPLEALAFATACHDVNLKVQNELDAMANNLSGEGVGRDCVQIVHDVLNAGDQFSGAALGARDEYARHVATQADIAGNTELRDTVAGTYLDTARA